MTSCVKCESDPKHYTRCIDAAREMADGKLGDCKCGGKRHYYVEQTSYNPITKGKQTDIYEVEEVYRRFSSAEAEYEGWDPMIFCMRHNKKGKIVFWPQYWIINEKGKWQYARSSPLFTIKDLEDLEKMTSKFR